MRYILPVVIAALLLTACEKLPQPGDSPFNITMYDLKGQKLDAVYAGLKIKIVDEQFRDIIKQVNLTQHGSIVFDKKDAPILEAKDNYIITAVPILDYIDGRLLRIDIRINNLYRLLCPACIIYNPTVTGNILAGFSGGKSDGSFEWPAEMATDAGGNIYVIDQKVSHDIILKVTPTGTTTPFAGAAGEFGRLVGIGIDHIRNLMYVSDATAQRVLAINMSAPSTITTLAGSGVAGNTDGTGTAASFQFDGHRVDDVGSSEKGQGLTLDASGNIYVGERYGSSENYSDIRRITPAGEVSTVAGSRIIAMSEEEVAVPAGLCVTAAGEIYYVHGASGLFQGVSKLSGGVLTRLAGKDSFEGMNDGTGSVAEFACPKAIRQSGSYLYVADASNGALRRVDATGTVFTLAGVGHFQTNRFAAGGMYLPPVEGSYSLPLIYTSPDTFEMLATAIRMDQPGGIAIPRAGLIYLSDHGYKCIWKITIR